jgi:molybdopterin-containing oxidoreductase family iron-sulfur binding subunit
VRDGQRATVIHVEPRYSMTAAAADEWIESAPGTEILVALALLRIVLDERLNAPLPAKEVDTLVAVSRRVEVDAAARQSGVPAARLRRIAEQLAKDGPSLVVGGGVAVTGPTATDAAVAVHLLNYALGSVGRTVRFGENDARSRASRYADLGGLIQAMARGEIDVLVVKDANPAYALPPRSGFGEAIKRVPFVVSLSSHPDETSALAHLVIPDLTPLESWGDYVPREGVWGLMQPAMGPVPAVGRRREDALDLVLKRTEPSFPGVATKATGDLLLDTGRAIVPGSEKGAFEAKTFADYLRAAWQALAKTAAPGVAFDTFWEDALRRGGHWAEVAPARVALQATVDVRPTPPALDGPSDGLVLMVVPSSRYYDGRSANKVWLHEAPDPMTQLVYDSWLEVPGEVAQRLGVRTGDVVKVESSHGQLEVPVLVSETLQAGTVAMPTGLGHTEYGRYARGRGQSPVTLLSGEPDPTSGGVRWLGVRVTLSRTGRRETLASPAGVTEVDHEREILESLTLAEAVALEKGGPAKPHDLPSMYPALRYPAHRWGMAIDLDACTGCQACVVACQAENNVPVVGKADIDYGRSLAWLRVERWWDRGLPPGTGKGGHAETSPLGPGVAHAAEGAPAGRPRARFLPMLCQHCAVAPCEPVCPVFAAYHTDEGLNGQVYNRCVGTRYCGNNCPYMVRRFNWYRYDWPAPMTLVLNPDVTVRDRGVMEKCTMCVQRIIAGKARARDDGRKPRDGEIQTACQQTCPTQAITFGDLKDEGGRAARLAASPRGYHVLGELGTRPAVTYLKPIDGERGA